MRLPEVRFCSPFFIRISQLLILNIETLFFALQHIDICRINKNARIHMYLYILLSLKIINNEGTYVCKSERALGNGKNIRTIFNYRRKQWINFLARMFYASKFNIIFIFNIVFISIYVSKSRPRFRTMYFVTRFPARSFILSPAWSPDRTSASREVLAATLCVVPRSVMPSLTIEGGIEKGGSWSFVARLRLDAHVRIVNTRQDSSPAHQKT